ncbi:MAG: hypothetical protein KDJ48_13205 [Nitratireductor sp.]|nr:hypothetical protein [Nitratireductor sp.]
MIHRKQPYPQGEDHAPAGGLRGFSRRLRNRELHVEAADDGLGHDGVVVPRATPLKTVARMLGAFVVVLLLAGLMSGAGLYFLLRGEAIENSTLNQRIEERIQQMLGRKMLVNLGRMTIAFDRDGLLSLAASDVQLLRPVDRQIASRLGKVVVGIRPWSLLSGEPQIDAVIIQDSSIDVSLLPLPQQAPIPADLPLFLENAGRQLDSFAKQFAGERFRLFRFENIVISGAGLGRRSADPIHVDNLELRFRRNGALTVSSGLFTAISRIEMEAAWRKVAGEAAELDMRLKGINLREWVGDPAIEDGFAGSDSRIDIYARTGFSAEGAPLNPQLSISSADPGTLRLGRYARTQINQAQLNFRLLTDKNQIELDPSNFSAGNFSSRLIGGIRPVDAKAGYAGKLEFELIADPAVGAPTVVGEQSTPAAIRVGGSIDRNRKIVDLSEILVLSGFDRISGSASFGFEGPTPSIAAAAASDGMQMSAIKQLWPFFLAPPTRNWAMRNIVGGRISDIDLSARIPAGIVGRFIKGEKIAPGDLVLTADFSDVRMDTFGELPAIRNASGKIAVDGMTFTADLAGGEVYMPDDRIVRLTSGNFRVGDYGERPALAEVKVQGEGDARSLALIANSKPLLVADRLLVRPAQFSGKADVDVAASFRLKPGLTPEDVDWHVLLDTKGLASSEKMFGRSLAKADLLIEATPQQARITGNAVVDNVSTKLSLLQPLGKNAGPAESEFSAELDEKARKAMGINLAPVIRGVIRLSASQGGSKDGKQVVDLADAEIDLPWVGWTKGKGIPATASFVMKNADGQTRVSDFYLEGPGFSATGNMVFDKNGIVSADMPNVSLNDGDALSVTIKRKGNLYTVNAEGARFDARSLINMLIHEGGVGDVQANINAQVTASIGTVTGFADVKARNVSLSYGTAKGWFDNLTLRGNFASSGIVNILASTVDRKTTFNIESSDAGAALGMLDIYRRMRGGNLRARLDRTGGGPFSGPIRVSDFEIIDEPKLARLVSDPPPTQLERGQATVSVAEQLRKVNVKRVRFTNAKAMIEKGEGYFNARDGVLTSTQIGFTFDGIVYNEANRMDLKGTFMPGIGLSRALGFIPIVGELLGNGRDTSLIGITYRLSGPVKNPSIEVNPVSLVAPGAFRKVFEFRD